MVGEYEMGREGEVKKGRKKRVLGGGGTWEGEKEGKEGGQSDLVCLWELEFQNKVMHQRAEAWSTGTRWESQTCISKSFISLKRRILDHSWPSPASNFIEQKADRRNGTDNS